MSEFRDDDQIRERALELAMQLMRDRSPTPAALIETAEKFYDFMTKNEPA